MKQKLLVLFVLFHGLVIESTAQSNPELIKVAGGTFEMGNEQGGGESDEQPKHTVILKTFNMAQTETTVLQWKTYCRETAREMPKTPAWNWLDTHAIVNISWDDAVGYCDWLSNKTGKLYRLPTEAEWEYAARGGKLSKGLEYSGEPDITTNGWYAGGGGAPRPVAKKRANELGLYDMSGNVWEWCQDWYGDYTAEEQINPTGPKSGAYRVLRGGSWVAAAANCRVRFKDRPDNWRNNTGFRVVVSE